MSGTELFTLYDTYGFPVELSTEEARRAGIAVSPEWRAEFDEKMAEQRARSQGASKMRIQPLATRPRSGRTSRR